MLQVKTEFSCDNVHVDIHHDSGFELEQFSWDDVHVDIPSDRGFVLGKRLGSGTTSTVYKAHHAFHGHAAVKSIKPIYADYVKAELDLLCRIQGHAHVIHVFDAWNDHDKWYIAMELVEGTLLDRMDQGMTVDDIQDAAKQIAAGLTFLHAKDIVHFDLKPENIGYVTQADGRVIYKLMDFGTSEFLSTVQSTDFQNGVLEHSIVKTSKYYRAYELFGFDGGIPDTTDIQSITDKVDVWSFGCILFEMLTNRVLFENLEKSQDLSINKTTFIEGWFDAQRCVSTAPSAKQAELVSLALECVTPYVSKRPNSFTVYTKL
jgi:serine/threonine protein kinase